MKFFHRNTVKHPGLWLGGAITFLTVVSLGNMTRWSIWFDEAFGAYLLRFGYGGIAKYTAVDVHPPLYYWTLKLWTDLFGTSELAFRSLSLLFAIITLIGVFILIRRLFSTQLAVVASWAVALSPMLIRYSDEARMYTMVTAIAIWATYVLVRATEKPTTRRWVVYGLLVAAGMWTHYFTALVWLSHWAWRAIIVRDETKKGKRLKAFFSKSWLLTHVLAVGLFLPWLPFAVQQFTTVQTGFWIPQISTTTPLDYLSALYMYLVHDRIGGWVAVLFFVVAGLSLWAILKAKSQLFKQNKRGYQLLVSMIAVPPLLLVLLSMPPLKSSFVDRYVLISMLLLAALIAMSVAVLVQKKVRYAKLTVVLLVATAIFGITNVYYFGNYNFTSDTSIRVAEVVRAAANASEDGTPIIADGPWVYYEAAFYSTPEHPLYFPANSTNYQWGSLAMLKENEIGKIDNIEDFAAQHRYVWFMGNVGNGEITAPVEGWKQIKLISYDDPINQSSPYKAALYDTQPSAE